MKRLSPIFQIFFKVLLIFLITFVWIRYFVKSLVSSIIISAILTMLIDFLTRLFIKKRTNKIFLKNSEQRQAEDIFLTLSTTNKGFSFLKETISKKYEITSKKKFFLYNDKLIYPLFSLSPISTNEIIEVMNNIQNEKAKTVIIVSGDFSNDCQKIITLYDKKIILLNQYETYEKIYKSYDNYPAISNKINQIKKTTMKDLLAFSFNRSRTKGYVFSAIIIFLCSLFVRASLYYAIITSLLLIFAIISFVNPYFNKKPLNEDI